MSYKMKALLVGAISGALLGAAFAWPVWPRWGRVTICRSASASSLSPASLAAC